MSNRLNYNSEIDLAKGAKLETASYDKTGCCPTEGTDEYC